jgi:ketosteroid isomerase-like protein
MGDSQGMSEADHIALVRSGFEAARAGRFEEIAGLLAADVKWHGGDPTATGSCQNRQQALEFMRQAQARNGIGELVEVIDGGEEVVVVLRPGADQRPVANLTRFRDGRVVEMVHYPNPEDAIAALRNRKTPGGP